MRSRLQASTAAPQADAGSDVSGSVAWALLVAAVVLDMLLSAPALFGFGIPYDAPGGSFAAKVHPGSYLLLASFVAGLAGRGNPLAAVGWQLARMPLVGCYLGCMLLVFAWAVGRHGTTGLAFIIDTLLMPAIAALCMAQQPAARQRRLLGIVMSLLALNAAIALGEFASGHRLVPLTPGRDDVVEEAFFRSSALLGHPLLNALVTVSLLPAVGLLALRAPLRLALQGLLVLALLSFGGRSALAGALVYALLAALRVGWRAARGRYGYQQLSGGLFTLALGGSALAAVVSVTGIGERIFKNLTWDNSANVRLRVWDVLDFVHGADLWIGLPIAQIDHIAQRIGIDLRYEAIENFWLYLLLLLGIVGFVPFVAGIAALFTHLWRRSGASMRMAVVAYLLLASGANTLASKSVSLLLLTVAVQAGAAPRGAGRAVTGLRRRALERPQTWRARAA